MLTEKQVQDYIEFKNGIDSMCEKIAIEVAIIRNLIKPGCDERYIATDVSVGNFETTVTIENSYDYDDFHYIKFPTEYLTFPSDSIAEAEQKRIEFKEQEERKYLARLQANKEEKERQLLKELKEKYES